VLLGIAIESNLVLVGGLTLFALLAFQMLVGLRKIKFKGRLHSKVHKWTAYVMLAVAVFHGAAALAYLGII